MLPSVFLNRNLERITTMGINPFIGTEPVRNASNSKGFSIVVKVHPGEGGRVNVSKIRTGGAEPRAAACPAEWTGDDKKEADFVASELAAYQKTADAKGIGLEVNYPIFCVFGVTVGKKGRKDWYTVRCLWQTYYTHIGDQGHWVFEGGGYSLTEAHEMCRQLKGDSKIAYWPSVMKDKDIGMAAVQEAETALSDHS
jgi:hypothetical protein